MTDHHPRTALVTGASRGIGRAVAERLARDGLLVAVHYGRDDVAAKETVAAITGRGGRAFAVRADLAVPGAADRLFDAVERGLRERTGGIGLDVLVNNAGIGCRGDVEQLTEAALDRVLTVNVKAPVLVGTTERSALASVDVVREWQQGIAGSELVVLPGDSYLLRDRAGGAHPGAFPTTGGPRQG